MSRTGRRFVVAQPAERRLVRRRLPPGPRPPAGPDLRVWLTDAPVKEGEAGRHVFDDGAYVGLGKLKGNKGSQNKGSQNYTLSDDIDQGVPAAGWRPRTRSAQGR